MRERDSEGDTVSLDEVLAFVRRPTPTGGVYPGREWMAKAIEAEFRGSNDANQHGEQDGPGPWDDNVADRDQFDA